jgi:hypothetical protein
MRTLAIVIVAVSACGSGDDCPAYPNNGVACTVDCTYWEGQHYWCVNGRQVADCSSFIPLGFGGPGCVVDMAAPLAPEGESCGLGTATCAVGLACCAVGRCFDAPYVCIKILDGGVCPSLKSTCDMAGDHQDAGTSD